MPSDNPYAAPQAVERPPYPTDVSSGDWYLLCEISGFMLAPFGFGAGLILLPILLVALLTLAALARLQEDRDE